MSIYTSALARIEEETRLNKNLGHNDSCEHTESKEPVSDTNRSEAAYIVKRAKELGITPFEFIMRPLSEKK
jgi:hypothetical protein